MTRAIKRTVDVLVSFVTLAILSPLLILVAASIRIGSAGPIFFRQARLGKKGIPFEILKFRTMFVNTTDVRNPDGSAYTSAADARVTPIGRLLRSSSLDELPQLWNVLKGEMSLVGPRPDQVDQLRFYKPSELWKLEAIPGITGMAQIQGRNTISWERRKQIDVEYIRNWSLAVDCKLLLLTIPYVLLGRDVNQE